MRLAVAGNPRTTWETSALLAQDEDERVRVGGECNYVDVAAFPDDLGILSSTSNCTAAATSRHRARWCLEKGPACRSPRSTTGGMALPRASVDHGRQVDFTFPGLAWHRECGPVVAEDSVASNEAEISPLDVKAARVREEFSSRTTPGARTPWVPRRSSQDGDCP